MADLLSLRRKQLDEQKASKSSSSSSSSSEKKTYTANLNKLTKKQYAAATSIPTQATSGRTTSKSHYTPNLSAWSSKTDWASDDVYKRRQNLLSSNSNKIYSDALAQYKNSRNNSPAASSPINQLGSFSKPIRSLKPFERANGNPYLNKTQTNPGSFSAEDMAKFKQQAANLPQTTLSSATPEETAQLANSIPKKNNIIDSIIKAGKPDKSSDYEMARFDRVATTPEIVAAGANYEGNPLTGAQKIMDSYQNNTTVFGKKVNVDPYKNMQSADSGQATTKLLQYTDMSQDEKDKYNAIYATSGKEAAERYHKSILSDINKRIAQKEYESTRGTGTVGKIGEGVNDLARSFSSGAGRAITDTVVGIPNTITGSDYKSTPSVNDYTGEIIRQNAQGVGGIALDLTSSTGYMAPSLITGQALGSLGMSAQAAGRVSSVLFGTSQAGAAYQEAIDQGYDKEGAQLYAMQQGVDEWATNQILGGIGSYGGGALQKTIGNSAVGKAAKEGINKVFKTPTGRIIANKVLQIMGQNGGEAAQEYLQFFTQNFTKNVLFNENNSLDWKDPDAIYSAFLGFLNAYMLNAPSNMADMANSFSEAKNNPITDYAEVSDAVDTDETHYKDNKVPNEVQTLKDVSDTLAQKVEQGKSVTQFEQTMYEQAIKDASRAAAEADFNEDGTAEDIDGTEITSYEELSDAEQAAAEQETVQNINQEVSAESTDKTDTAPKLSESLLTEVESPSEQVPAETQKQAVEPTTYSQNVPSDMDSKSPAAIAIKSQSDTTPTYTAREGSDVVRADIANKQQMIDLISNPDSSIMKLDDGTYMYKEGDTISVSRNNQEHTYNLKDAGTNTADDILTVLPDNATASIIFNKESVPNSQKIHTDMIDAIVNKGTVEDAITTSVYGEYGNKTYNSLQHTRTGNQIPTVLFNQFFNDAYNAGRYDLGVPSASMLPTDMVKQAYNAGVQDRIMAMSTKAQERTEGEGGLVSSAAQKGHPYNKAAEVIGKLTGAKITIDSEISGIIDGKKYSANGWQKGDTIHIALDTDNFLATLGHEIIHFLQAYAPAEYEAYKGIVVKALAEDRGVEIEDLVKEYGERYGMTNRDAIMDEIAADAGDFFNDPNFHEQIAKENLTLAQKIADFFKDIIDAIDSLINKSEAKPAEALRNNKKLCAQAYEQWMKAIRVAKAAGGSYQVNTDNSIGKKYEIKTDDRGFQYVKLTVDQEKFNGLSKSQKKALAKKIILERFVEPFGMPDYNARMIKEDAKEYAYKGDKDKKIINAKMRLSTEIDNLLQISTLIKDHVSDSGKHKDVAYWTYRKGFFEVNGKMYSGDIQIMNFSNGTQRIHDITKIEEASTEQRKTNVSPASDGSASSTDNITQSEKEVNKGNNILPNKEDIQLEINESMTMEKAKDMLNRLFVANGIKEWFDGEYKNADEWLKDQGANAVSVYLDNDQNIYNKYLTKIPGVIEDRFYSEDILNAYLAGTLVGKQEVQKSGIKATEKVDLGKAVKVSDNRFYAPQAIDNAVELMSIANQKVTAKNKAEVNRARAKILLYAHNKGAIETLGITETELNKKLRSWSNYSKSARELSTRINRDSEESNRWTGIENLSYVARSTVSQDELSRMVKGIEGTSSEYQRNYIARAMLGLDSHIDWSDISFKFGRIAKETTKGLYSNSEKKITIDNTAYDNTVAHEMGHALDYKWASEIGVGGALSDSFNSDLLEYQGDLGKWYRHFKEFVDDITDSGDTRSSYTMDAKETFARFVAKFVEWAEKAATGRDGIESSYYSDKFTTAQYVDFARILQEKSALDSQGKTDNKLQIANTGNTAKFTTGKASNGAALSEGQQEYFKNTKVVDDKGNLLVMYHGSGVEHDTFDKKTIGQHHYQSKLGFFFTSDKGHADSYANLADTRYSPEEWRERVFNNKEQLGHVFESYINITNPLYYRSTEWPAEDFYDNNYLNIMDHAETDGIEYDGIIIDGRNGDNDNSILAIPFNSNQIKDINNVSPTDNENIKFSLKAPVEQTKDLIATHALSEDNLQRALDIGGLPMPSIAVSTGKGGTRYGDISLVFDKSSIDPATDARNKIYKGDAYTVTNDYGYDDTNINDMVASMIKGKAQNSIEQLFEDDFTMSTEGIIKLVGNRQQLNSIDEVKANEGLLNADKYETPKYSIDEISEIVTAANEDLSYDDVDAAIYKCATDGLSTIAQYKDSLSDSFGYTVDNSLAKNVKDIVDFCFNVARDYFEAKPERAVGFDEVKAAIVPEGTSKDLIKKLEDYGIEVKTYSGKEQRISEINSLENMKFSIKPNQIDTTQELINENEQFENFNTELGKAIANIDKTQVSYDDVFKIVKKMAKEYNSDIDIDATTNLMMNLYEYISNTKALTAAKISTIASQIARPILENSTHRDMSFAESYPGLREQLRDMKIRVPEADRRGETFGYENYWDMVRHVSNKRQGNNRLLTITEDGLDVDAAYQELHEQYPNLFPEDIITIPEQMEQIIEVAKNLQGTVVSGLGGNLDEDSYYLGQELIETFYDSAPMKSALLQAKQDLKAKYEVRLRKAKQDLIDMRQKISQQYKDALAAHDEKQAKKFQQMYKDLQANHASRIMYMQNELRERQQRERLKKNDSAARTYLLQQAKALMKMKGGPDFEYAKNEIIGNLDIISKGMRDNTRQALEDLYEQVYKQSALDEDYAKLNAPKYNELFRRLKTVKIADMSAADVSELTDQILALKHSQENYNRMIRDQNGARIATEGRKLVTNQHKIKGIDYTKKLSTAIKQFTLDSLSPVRAFRMLSGYEDDAVLANLAQDLNNGQTKAKQFEMDSEKMFAPLLKDTKFVNSLNKQNIEISNAKGDKAKITPGMRISLYLHYQNTQNLDHINYGGINIPNELLYKQGKFSEAYNQGSILQLKPTDIKRIISQMSPEEIQFAKTAEEFFNVKSKEAINETSLLLDGYEKAKIDHYMPIKTDKNFTQTDLSGLIQDGTVEGMGILKERKSGAVNPILLEDISNVLDRQIKNVERYTGLAIPIRNINKVLNYTATGYADSSMSSIAKTWGNAGKNYITNLLSDLNTGGRDQSRGPLEKLRSRYAGVTLAVNAGVAIKQASSYPMAASVLDTKSLVKALSHWVTPSKAEWDRIDSITPWFWDRRQGMSTRELGEIASRRTMIGDNTTVQKIKDMFNWIQKVDVKTTAVLFYATENYIQDHNPSVEVGSEQYNKLVAEKYNEVLQRTQPSYDTMQRSEILRKTDLLSKTIGMFKTQSFQMGGELYDSFGEWRARADEYKADKTEANSKKVKAAQKNFNKTTSAVLVAQALFAGMSIAARAFLHKMNPYKDDEEGKITSQTMAKQFSDDLGGSLAGMVFGGTQLYDAGKMLFTQLTGKGDNQWYDVTSPGLDMINQVVTSTGKLATVLGKLAQGETTLEQAKTTIGNFAIDSSAFAGIPLNNIYDLLNSANLWYQDIRDGKAGTFESGSGLFGLKESSISNKQYYNRMFNDIYERGDSEAFANDYNNLQSDEALTQLKKKFSETDEVKTIAQMYADGNTAGASKAYEDFVNKMGKQYEPVILGGVNKAITALSGTEKEEETFNPISSEDTIGTFSSDKQQAFVDAGGSAFDYTVYSNNLKTFSADKDKDGKTISGSLKKKKIKYIDALPITTAQKKVLYGDTIKADDEDIPNSWKH